MSNVPKDPRHQSKFAPSLTTRSKSGRTSPYITSENETLRTDFPSTTIPQSNDLEPPSWPKKGSEKYLRVPLNTCSQNGVGLEIPFYLYFS